LLITCNSGSSGIMALPRRCAADDKNSMYLQIMIFRLYVDLYLHSGCRIILDHEQ
jgi:hypothetical protein